MKNKSQSKENIKHSYFDMTSPLSNLQKAKHKSQLKKSIHNSFVDKLAIYKDDSSNNNQTLPIRSHASLSSLKASTLLYKLPEFTAPEVNYQISQSIKQKANQIKQEMVNNFPSILNSSTSLPSLVPKSSNYNPKKLQNLLGHRSSILQLQAWLRNSLSKNPPTSPQQLIQYKQMIMGVGMKQLIRLINSRCLEEGKLVEQVWELTWSICKQIIMHMALRTKKGDQILSQQIQDLQIGYKKAYQEKDKELSELRKKVEQYDEKIREMSEQIEELTLKNQMITAESNKNFLQSNYVNEQFLNVLQENLAMYLHLGDNKKRDWIKKMYKQVSKAKISIKDELKRKVNKTVQNRIKQQKIYSDQISSQKDLIPDEDGNFRVFTPDYTRQENEKLNQNQNRKQNQKCDNLKDMMQNQFSTVNSQTQTQTIQTNQNQAQSDILVYQDKQVGQDHAETIQVGVSTETQQTKQNQKKQKAKTQKNKVQKKTNVKGSPKNKFSKRISQISQSNGTKQNFSIASSNDLNPNRSLISEQQALMNQEQNAEIQIIDYVCKQCYLKKSKDQALKEIKFQDDLEKLKNQIQRLKAINLLSISENIERSQSGERFNFQNNSDNNSRNDKSPKVSSKQIHNQQISTANKNSENKNNSKARLSTLKNDLNKDIKNFNKQESEKISQRSLGKLEKNRKILKSIQERQTFEQGDNNADMKKGKNGLRKNNLRLENNMSPMKSQKSEKNQGQSSPKSVRNKQKRSSSIIHDISVKKQIEKFSQFKDAINNMLKQQTQEIENCQLEAKLPLGEKEPYFKFFTQRITQANHEIIDQITSQSVSFQLTLNNYFSIVQEINSIPESKINISEKQMLTIIEKNLMPIILQLLNTVKKSLYKKNVDEMIKTFHSLPFILMNKFSTKYGVKILAIKNMKLLLSSLKKIQLVTDRYKSLRLMLFTDCRAIYSEDLFVYLLVLALITPHLDVERPISFQQVTQIRQICQKYLTKDKSVYTEFESLTKEALSFNKSQQSLNTLKLAPLLRSIISSYRMAKINRIEQIGFVFLMLKKQNYLEYLTFSFFMSCLKIQIQLKVKIVKTFLGYCDMKNKNKRVAMTESGFSRFLIHCPEFNFEFLNSTVIKQLNQLHQNSSESLTKKNITLNKRMSQQLNLSKINANDIIKRLENEDLSNHQMLMLQNPLKTEKKILLQSKKSSIEDKELVTEKALSQSFNSQEFNINQVEEKVNDSLEPKLQREKRHCSLTLGKEAKTSVAQKTKNYSYFTFQISRFLQNEQETRFMSQVQKIFVSNYLMVHVMACEVEEMIGLIDYFSQDMLEIICCDGKELKLEAEQAAD